MGTTCKATPKSYRRVQTARNPATTRVADFLDYLVGLAKPVRLHYLWRPQLADVADEMVLETAINGRADCIVTFNTRHFGAAARFGIETIWPSEAMRRLR